VNQLVKKVVVVKVNWMHPIVYYLGFEGIATINFIIPILRFFIYSYVLAMGFS
jgi:hypothetical protein